VCALPNVPDEGTMDIFVEPVLPAATAGVRIESCVAIADLGRRIGSRSLSVRPAGAGDFPRSRPAHRGIPLAVDSAARTSSSRRRGGDEPLAGSIVDRMHTWRRSSRKKAEAAEGEARRGRCRPERLATLKAPAGLDLARSRRTKSGLDPRRNRRGAPVAELAAACCRIGALARPSSLPANVRHKVAPNAQDILMSEPPSRAAFAGVSNRPTSAHACRRPALTRDFRFCPPGRRPRQISEWSFAPGDGGLPLAE